MFNFIKKPLKSKLRLILTFLVIFSLASCNVVVNNNQSSTTITSTQTSPASSELVGVNVDQPTLVAIEVDKLPTNINYSPNQVISTSGGVLRVVLSDYSVKYISMNDQMIDESRLNMSTLGNSRVSIKYSYLNKTLFTSYNINVVPFLVNLNGVSLDIVSSDVLADQAVQLNPIFAPTNAYIFETQWSSSNPLIASVDNNGLVTPKNAGVVTITVLVNGKYSASSRLNILQGEIKEVAEVTQQIVLVPTDNITYALTSPSPSGTNIITTDQASSPKTISINVANNTSSVAITGTKLAGQSVVISGTNAADVTAAGTSTAPTYTVNTSSVASNGGAKVFTFTVSESNKTNIVYNVSLNVESAIPPTANLTYSLTTPAAGGSNTISVNQAASPKTISITVANSTSSVVITAGKTSTQSVAIAGTNSGLVTAAGSATVPTYTVNTSTVASAGGTLVFVLTVSESNKTNVVYNVTINVPEPSPQMLLNLDASNTSSYSGSGSTWTNLVGNNNLTISPSGVFNSANGGSIVFNGTSTIVALDTLLTPNTSYSYEAWVYDNPGSSNARNIISSFSNVFWINGTTLSAGVGGEYSLVTYANFPKGVWKHVAVTFNTSTNTMVLYVDGAQVSSNTNVVGEVANEFLRIGAHSSAVNPGSPVSFWNGRIASVKIYNYSVTQAQVENSFFESRLRFSEIVDLRADVYSGSGNWLDQSSNSNNGIISGAQNLGNAFIFDGLNDRIALPNNIIPWTTDSFSMAVSFKAYDNGVILGQIGSGYVPAIRIGADNKLYADIFYSGDAGKQPRVIFDNIVYGEWYKLMLSYQKPASVGGDGTLTGYLYRAFDNTTVTKTNTAARITDYGGPYQYYLGYGRSITWTGADANKGDHSYFNGEIGRFYAAKELFASLERTRLINEFEEYLSNKSASNYTNTQSAFNFVNTTTNLTDPFVSGFSSYLFGDYSYISTRYESSDFILDGDLTIEWYQYKTDATNRWARVFQISYGANYNTGFGFSIEDSGLYVWSPGRNYFGAAGDYRATYNDRWVHFAIVRQSGVIKLYIDGVSIPLRINTTQAPEPFVNQPSFITIGRIDPRDNTVVADMNGQFEGYISQFRIVKGTAVYTSNFTRPALPLMVIPGTILILNP